MRNSKSVQYYVMPHGQRRRGGNRRASYNEGGSRGDDQDIRAVELKQHWGCPFL